MQGEAAGRRRVQARPLRPLLRAVPRDAGGAGRRGAIHRGRRAAGAKPWTGPVLPLRLRLPTAAASWAGLFLRQSAFHIRLCEPGTCPTESWPPSDCKLCTMAPNCASKGSTCSVSCRNISNLLQNLRCRCCRTGTCSTRRHLTSASLAPALICARRPSS
jgi:hypothetical protein